MRCEGASTSYAPRAPIGDGVGAEVHAEAAAELSSIARDRARLNALAESDMFAKRELAPKFAALKKREQTAKASLDRPVAVVYDPHEAAATLVKRWKAYQAGSNDAAEMLHDEVALLVESIDVAPIKPGSRRNVYDPARIRIHLRPNLRLHTDSFKYARAAR